MTRAFESLESDDLRDCQLYRVRTFLHPGPRFTRETERGYIGESARAPLARLQEHDAQPWGDLVSSVEIDPTIYRGKTLAVAAEKAAIEEERPRYNVEFNLANADRISRDEAVRQRHERDDLLGRPHWVDPKQPGYRATRARPSAVPLPAAPSRRWRPWQVKVALWAGGWLLLWPTGWGYALAVGFTGTPAAVVAGIGGAGLLLWGVRRRPRRRKRR